MNARTRNTALHATALLLLALHTGCGNGAGEAGKASAVVADSGAVRPLTDGMQEIMGEDGNLRMRGELRGGKRHGPWTSYFPNGIIRSRATYVDGVEQGPTEVYHENGMTYYTGQYHNGTTVGEWIFYDPQGVELERVAYDSTGTLLK